MTTPITVVIPVGPRAEDCAYLAECRDSLAAQIVPPAQVIIVDDMHGHHDGCYVQDGGWSGVADRCPVHWEYAVWNLGVAGAFNYGVAKSGWEHVLLLGADDYLEPGAIAAAERAIEAHPYTSAYYFFGVRYLDDRQNPLQTEACGAAVVTKSLWRETGGFPVEAAVGRSDTMLVGLLMSHPDVGALVPIENAEPLYNVRVHEHQHTASRGPWVPALEATAQAYWTTWTKPQWGRYA